MPTNLNAPEPMPHPGVGRDIWSLVVEDMKSRDQLGFEKYKQRLQIHDGRNHLVDAYQECLDQAVYLRQEIEERQSPKTLNDYAAECHTAAAQWWKCLRCEGTGQLRPGRTCPDCKGTGKAERDVAKLLMLIVSELAEAMEGHRKDLADTHLTHRKMFEVELADAAIRIFDLAASQGCDLEGAYREKLLYNAAREDHKPEARKAAGGKKY